VDAAQSAGTAVRVPGPDQEFAIGRTLDEAISQLTEARERLKQMMVAHQVRINTHKLRTYDDPYWARLRQLLHDRGFDINRTAYIYGFSEDASLEVGMVVIHDPTYMLPLRTFYFELAWHYESTIDTAVFAEWREVSNKPEEKAWPEHMAFAKTLLLAAE
jgi:hypothetical protein